MVKVKYLDHENICIGVMYGRHKKKKKEAKKKNVENTICKGRCGVARIYYRAKGHGKNPLSHVLGNWCCSWFECRIWYLGGEKKKNG